MLTFIYNVVRNHKYELDFSKYKGKRSNYFFNNHDITLDNSVNGYVNDDPSKCSSFLLRLQILH